MVTAVWLDYGAVVEKEMFDNASACIADLERRGYMLDCADTNYQRGYDTRVCTLYFSKDSLPGVVVQATFTYKVGP